MTKRLILAAGLAMSGLAHATLPCDVYLDASSDEGTLRGLIARTNLNEKLVQRLSDAEYVALNAPEEAELVENERLWNEDAGAEAVSRRAAFGAMISHPIGRGLMIQENIRGAASRPSRDQLIEETIFAELGRENASYTHLLESRDRFVRLHARLEKHLQTLGRILGYLERARWWAGGVHVPDASWKNVNPVSLAYHARARQLAARISRRLQADMTEIEILLEPGHPFITKITAEEGVARLSTVVHRLENTRDQLNVGRALVASRVTEIVTRVKTLLPPHD